MDTSRRMGRPLEPALRTGYTAPPQFRVAGSPPSPANVFQPALYLTSSNLQPPPHVQRPLQIWLIPRTKLAILLDSCYIALAV